MISEQTEYHFNFILNKGLCSGCPACDNHSDVVELLSHWQKGNIEFFVTLYLGMQTIQFTMEHLLYDIIPVNKSVAKELTPDNILSFRQFIYSYVEAHSK